MIAHFDQLNRIADATGTRLDEMATKLATQFLDEASAASLGLLSERA